MSFLKKKLFAFVTLLCISPLLIGCGGENKKPKTEFMMGEIAKIDDYEVVYTKHYFGGTNLFVNFEITNHHKEKRNIDLGEDFVLYNELSEKLENISQGTIELASKETMNVNLVFAINSDLNSSEMYEPIDITGYKILFYSGVVSNNIGFILK